MSRELNRVIYRFWHEQSEKGKIGYIGQDSYHPARYSLPVRAKQKKNQRLYDALQKYPLDLWYKEILQRGVVSKEELNKAEMFWISHFDSKNRGYNCTDGGDGCRGIKKSSEYLKRQSEFFMWKPENPEEVLRLYCKDMLSLSALAKRFNTCNTAVKYFLLRNEIRIRNLRESMVILRSHFKIVGHPLKGKRHSEARKQLISNTSPFKFRPTTEDLREIERLYQEEFVAAHELAFRYKTAHAVIDKILKDAGVVKRGSNETRILRKKFLAGGSFAAQTL